MKYENVSIAALGWEIPPGVLTSAALEDRLAPLYARLGLEHGRLELMTGIKERRFWPSAVLPSEVAARAAEHALSRVSFPRDAIGCVIHASVSRDCLEPATASFVHHRLGLSPRALAFDLSNACLGVVNGLMVVANMIELGQIAAGLVVSGENGLPLVESTIAALLRDEGMTRKTLKPWIASLTIGSGAAAVLLARSDLVARGHRIVAACARAATEHNALCRGGVPGDERSTEWSDSSVESARTLGMRTDSEALLTQGVALAKATWAEFVEGLPARLPNKIVTHQVGKAHHRLLLEELGLAPSSAYTTYETLGNMGSASLPVTLALAAEEDFIRPGDVVGLLGIGSGLASAMLAVEW